MAKTSRHALDGKIIKIGRGLAIYKTRASPFWNARVLDPGSKRYIVRSTKEISRIRARSAALEFVATLYKMPPAVPTAFTFKHYATRFMEKGRLLVEQGERNANYIRTMQLFLDNDEWGLMRCFGDSDVRSLRTRDFLEFMNDLTRRKSDLSSSTRNGISATFRNVLKVARDDGVIDFIPDTPRAKQRDNPRPFFRFYPLVPIGEDEYARLVISARMLALADVEVRGVPITDELGDLIEFTVASFVRPTTTELFAIRFSDVAIATNPNRLLVTIRKGKTGHRIANTMSQAIEHFERAKKRHPSRVPEDFLFLPRYFNRMTASRIIQRQFLFVLNHSRIGRDKVTGTQHSLYSLRHTAICMRLVQSEGQVNIYSLAKNAGTSVEQIERFYARNLPLSAEMVRNLQSSSGMK